MVLITACASQPGPYQITSFWPVDCANPVAPENRYSPAGHLDVGPGGPVSFLIGTTISGVTAQPSTEVNGVVLEPANRNQGVIKQTIVTYKLSRSLGTTPAQFVTNMTAPLEGDTDALVQLISPELSDLLINGLSSARDLSDVVDITANVEFRGTFSADGHAFTTGSLDFPIRAYKSGDCPGGGGFGSSDGGTTSEIDTSCYYPGQFGFSAGFACPP
jgi:hypothetical protein